MNFDKEVDARGLNCPLPILRAKKMLAEAGLFSGAALLILASEISGSTVYSEKVDVPM